MSLREEYVKRLRTIYDQVDSPIEGPGKATFGDIDLIVASPSPSGFANLGAKFTTADERAAYSALFNTHACIFSPGNATLAIQHPTLPSAYVQLDISSVQPDLFEWSLFIHAHGDIWNLLSTSLRPFGLLVTTMGFYVSEPNIATFDKRRSRLFLTAQPSEVLEFLGLDRNEFYRKDGFESVERMFEFVCEMRFFRKSAYVKDRLKANDRARMGKRDTYRKFVEEWVASLPDLEEEGEHLEQTRKSVLEEALERWDKGQEWEELRRVWAAERHDLALKKYLKDLRRVKWDEDMAYTKAWVEAISSDVS